MTEPRKLDVELAAIKRQGYALDDEEFHSGLFCIAVPILGQDAPRMPRGPRAAGADRAGLEKQRGRASPGHAGRRGGPGGDARVKDPEQDASAMQQFDPSYPRLAALLDAGPQPRTASRGCRLPM